MASAALDAQNIRVRDALLLPYKRRIASWIIRSDIWQAAVKPNAKNEAARIEAVERAQGAVTELDAQVTSLFEIIFPPAVQSKLLDAELAKMKESYSEIRTLLLNIAATPVPAH